MLLAHCPANPACFLEHMNRSDEIQDHCCYAGTSLWQCPKCSLMFKNLLLVAVGMKDMMVPSKWFSLSPKTTMLWRIERTTPQLLPFFESLV